MGVSVKFLPRKPSKYFDCFFRQRLKLSMFCKKGQMNDAPDISSEFMEINDDVSGGGDDDDDNDDANDDNVDNLNDRIVEALKRSVDLLGPVKPYDARNASIRSDLDRTLLARLDIAAAVGTESSAVAVDRNRATVMLVDLLNDTSRLIVADDTSERSFSKQKSDSFAVEEAVAAATTTTANNDYDNGRRINLAKLSRFLRTVEREGEIALSGETTTETNDLYDALGQVPADVERFFSSDMARARDCALRAKVFDERIAPLVDWIASSSPTT